MKDKTHDMNRGYSGSVAEAGCEIIPNSEITTRSQYRKRKRMEAGVEGPTAPLNSSLQIEDLGEEDNDETAIGGFLPRNNYEDRF